ncbi:rCG51994 [Rattus norvegicus]|uniref:RCG51994 n=1 Tax=Rattus norvegicus TaxID=10116 RepID=A6K3R4_RAT|nr:rCG51994 [Rattus norvegicus]
MNRGASLLIGTTYLCSLGGGVVLKLKSATSESSCFCYAPMKTEAPRSSHSSRAPCCVPSFRIHHEVHAELCQEAS